MATNQANSSQQTTNALAGAAKWGLGAAVLVALAPLTVPTTVAVGVGAGVASALGVSLPAAAAVLGGWLGYNKPTS